MAATREELLASMLGSIDRSPLPDAQKGPFKAALSALASDRPQVMDKVFAPFGRALRNPMFPGLWEQAVRDIPKSPAYEPLVEAAQGIAAFVAAHRS
ncbi:MAG: hypothetical protein RLZZ383_2510 [Pseudomonadota bacterium]|jgi:hypothetical protein